MKRYSFIFMALSLLALFLNCGGSDSEITEGVPAIGAEPLRTPAATKGIYIGAAVDQWMLTNTSASDYGVYRGVLARHFNFAVSENGMKFSVISTGQNGLDPLKANYDYSIADNFVSFAEANTMKLRGHTLLWHTQIPSWITTSYSAVQLETIMNNHITEMLTHFYGKIYCWDVVNEAISDDATPVLRPESVSPWRKIGSDYIDKAFIKARAVDPSAKLIYNDYSVEEVNNKSDYMYGMIQGMQSRSVPIDGVGFQCHFSSDNPPNWTSLTNNIKRFTDLNIDVHLTEIDFRISTPVTTEKLQKQADNYRKIMQIALANPKVTVVTFWGFTDKYSWIPSFFSGTGAALPFDEYYNIKPAYNAILEELKK